MLRRSQFHWWYWWCWRLRRRLGRCGRIHTNGWALHRLSDPADPLRVRVLHVSSDGVPPPLAERRAELAVGNGGPQRDGHGVDVCGGCNMRPRSLPPRHDIVAIITNSGTGTGRRSSLTLHCVSPLLHALQAIAIVSVGMLLYAYSTQQRNAEEERKQRAGGTTGAYGIQR